jgi:hypothetical protein
MYYKFPEKVMTDLWQISERFLGGKTLGNFLLFSFLLKHENHLENLARIKKKQFTKTKKKLPRNKAAKFGSKSECEKCEKC